jgi:hypothetical protein
MLADSNKGPIRDRATARRRAPFKSPAVNRWSAWARSIATRHARFTQRRESLALIVRRSRSLHVIRERWSFTTRLVRPHLQLAINAVVKLAHWRQEQHFSHGTKSFLNTTQRALSHTGVVTRQPGGIERVVREIGHGSTTAQPSANFREQRQVLKQPLAFVFERVKASKSTTQTIPLANRLEILIHQQVPSVVERVTQQARRTETMLTGTSSLVERQIASTRMEVMQPPRLLKTVAPSTRVIEKSSSAPPVTTVIESAPWLPEKMPVAGLNIDQLTDQVVRQLDRRVVAARERMGRV